MTSSVKTNKPKQNQNIQAKAFSSTKITEISSFEIICLKIDLMKIFSSHWSGGFRMLKLFLLVKKIFTRHRLWDEPAKIHIKSVLFIKGIAILQSLKLFTNFLLFWTKLCIYECQNVDFVTSNQLTIIINLIYHILILGFKWKENQCEYLPQIQTLTILLRCLFFLI